MTGGSAAALVDVARGMEQRMGPCLATGMGGEAMVERLNSWGAARDRELIALRAELAAAQTGVSGAFGQAERALVGLATDWRLESEGMRAGAQREADSALARLELVVGDARTRFDAVDATRSADLVELGRRLAIIDGWAQAEPARFSALLRAAVPTSPGGTPQMFYPPTRAGIQQPQPQQHQQPQVQPTAAEVLAGPPVSFTPLGLGPMSGMKRPGVAPLFVPPPQPQTPPPQQPAWTPTPSNSGGADPWANYSAAPAPGADPWALNRAAGPAQHFHLGTPVDGKGSGKGGGFPQAMRINARDWGNDAKKLEVSSSFEAFQVWKARALMFLSRDRPDVRKLLTWAEAQTSEGIAAGLSTAAAGFGMSDLEAVEYALHDGIQCTTLDSLLSRARSANGGGCELWRALNAEWSGAAPQLKHAKARRYLQPRRATNMADLWAKLPAWERLGEEAVNAGMGMPEWMSAVALESLLPTPLLDAMVQRNELSSFSLRVAWVRSQMEHARGVAQATAFAPSQGGKDASGDAYMCSLAGPPGFDQPFPTEASDAARWAVDEAMAAGDYEAALFALKGAKGGKGGGRKGLGKGGGKDGSSGGKSADFNGACHYCGMWGHRQQSCHRKDADMAAGKGGGQGAKGGGKGKSGQKGGKGGPLAELAADTADGDWAEKAVEDAAAEDWDFNHLLGSLGVDGPLSRVDCPPRGVEAPLSRVELPPSRRHPRRGVEGPLSRVDLPPRCRPTQTAVHNSFDTLDTLNLLLGDGGDSDELIGAVAGETRSGRIVEAVIDSGAVHSVTPPKVFPGRVDASPWSRAGRGYRAANGTRIANRGQMQVPFGTAEGHRCKIPFQVADVEQPLISVAHLTAAGNRVELGDTDGRVLNVLSGRTIGLQRRGGVYIMKMFIADPEPQPFRRQGA